MLRSRLPRVLRALFVPIATLAGISIALVPGVSLAGTIYQPENYKSLVSDMRSFRVGDSLTVVVVESSTAESRASSSLQRNNDFEAVVAGSGANHELGLGANRKASGAGTTVRSGKLKAEISARVLDVADNGDLEILGSQRITVNGETQIIKISGIVRPIDISADNVVLSTRIAAAEIEYSGKGFVDRYQSESWWSRLLGFLGF